MDSDHLQFILTELPHLEDDGIRELYHEAASHSIAFRTHLQGGMAAAPGETAATWLRRRLTGLDRDQLLVLLLAVADGGFDDALRFMAHRLGPAADRRRMPPPPPLFGLPVRTAAAAGLPIRTAVNNAAAPHLGTGFADPDPSVGYNDTVDSSNSQVPLPPSVGPWVQTPQLRHDGHPGPAPTAPGVSGFEGQAPPPQSRLHVLAALESPAPAPTLNTTPLRHPATTGVAHFNPLERPASSPQPRLNVLADATEAIAALKPPTSRLNTTPLRHPATRGTARFNPLERPAGPRRPRSRPTTPAPPAPTAPAPAPPPNPSPPSLAGNPRLDWRPRSPNTPPQRPAYAPIAERMQDLPRSPQQCVRCGTTYLEAQNSGRRTCRHHAAYPVADAGMTAAWGAAAAAGVAAEPHFRPSLFARADLAGAFVWPCCGRRGGGPGPDQGCRAGIHVSEGTRLWRAPHFHGWERYGRQGREDG